MSTEHKKYLIQIRKKKLWIHICQFFLLIALLTIWQIASDCGMINAFIFSSPSKVFSTILSLQQDGTLYHHIWVTAYETILSFLLSSLIGLVVATILWWFDSVAKVLDPYFTVLNSLPKVALGPIILIWCGASMNSIILMAMLISVVVAILNIYQGFQRVDLEKMINLKLNISMCLIGVIMGEFLVSKEGIGYLIMYGSQVFHLNLVISGVVLLSILATLFYVFISWLEKLVIEKK